MKKILFIALLIATAIVSCQDSTGELGASISDFDDNLIYSVKTFNVKDSTVMADSICSRALYSYIGRLYDEETNVTLTANFMTQFIPRCEDGVFPDKDDIVKPTSGDEISYADSCYLLLYVNTFYGDSTAKMNIVAHELQKTYDETRRYPINYDPKEHGMIWEPSDGGVESRISYTTHNTALEMDDSTSTRAILIPLDKTFTRGGKKYNNYGSYLMEQYYTNPENFKSPLLFKENVCKGFYMENTYGQGAIGKITATALEFIYKLKDNPDSAIFRWFAGTKEVMQHNTITTKGEKTLKEFVKNCNKSDYTYVKSPVGIYTALTLNIDSIKDEEHSADSLSTVRLFLPVVNNASTTGYIQEPPSTLLMIRAKDKYSFFDEQKVIDYRTSFTATYTSAVNGYTFDNISTLISDIYNERADYMKTHNVTAEKYAEDNPWWEEVLLIPVETSTDSNSNLLTVSHSMLLQGTKLNRGTGKTDSPVKLSVIYSRFR